MTKEDKRFKPGEIAVLLTQNSARVMRVHKVVGEDVEQYVEEESQRPFAPKWSKWKVIRVETPDQAHRMVGRIEQVEFMRTEAHKRADEDAKKLIERIVKTYEMWDFADG